MGCCGDDVSTTYCSECECKDPTMAVTDEPCLGECFRQNWAGDGNCDDENNNCGCEYDGGDCCVATTIRPSGLVGKNYCKLCQCLDPDNQSDLDCEGTCDDESKQGDGRCDDANNNCGCLYDGGDCCGDNVNTDFCEICACNDPQA